MALVLVLGLGAVPARGEGRRLLIDHLQLLQPTHLRAYVNHVEGDGTPVTGLTAAHLKLTLDGSEEGAAATLVPFDSMNEPVYLVAVVQLSPAMEAVLGEAKKGLSQVAATLSALPGSKAGIIGYAADVKRVLEPAAPADFSGAVSRLHVDPEGTESRLLEAVGVGIDWLGAQGLVSGPRPARQPRRLLVVFSDGIDTNGERQHFSEVARRAWARGVPIDTIGYGVFAPAKLRGLQTLSRESFGIERGCKSPAEIVPRFSALSDELRRQYVAEFLLPQELPETAHTFVVVTDPATGPVYSPPMMATLRRPLCPDGGPAPCQAPSEGWTGKLGLGAWMGAAVALVAALMAVVLALVLRKKGPKTSQGRRSPLPPVPSSRPFPMPGHTPVQAPGQGRPGAIQPAQGRPGAIQPAQGRAGDHQEIKTVYLGSPGDAVTSWITGTSGRHVNQTFKLTASRMVLGSAPECDVVIEDPAVSRRHCELRRSEGGFLLVDLGSTNGTTVNGTRVREHPLRDFDLFRVGSQEFRYKSIDD